MTNEDWLAALEAEERRKDEAGAKAAQELADEQQRHQNKKVRDDPLDPFNCNHRMVDGEVPSPQLAKPIDVPAHPELKICDDVTGAINNFAIAKATDWKEKFGKRHAKEPVTLKTLEGDMTFNMSAKCIKNKTTNVYKCNHKGKELYIHDSNKPTLYPPTYLAYEQHQYDADPDHYNSRDAHIKECRELGIPGLAKTINIQRCKTDYLGMALPDPNQPIVLVPGIAEYKFLLKVKFCKSCLQQWKQSARAKCDCIMCTEVKKLDENTDHVLTLEINAGAHSYVNNPGGNETHGQGKRIAGQKRKKPKCEEYSKKMGNITCKFREITTVKYRRATLKPLNCVLHYRSHGQAWWQQIGNFGRSLPLPLRMRQWKMQWQREADDISNTPQNP